MIAPAAAARMTVARSDRTEAPIVTGAMMRSAKGFSSPPVRKSSAPSWPMSKRSVRSASPSLSRRFPEARAMAARLKAARAPMTNAACTCGMCIPSPSVATSTAAVWPRIASQRSRMSVRSRIQPLGAPLSMSGRSGWFIRRGIAAAPGGLKAN